ncbi:substrate-binding domain-containing protein [Cytobacillus oceanisediminis]|nr:substrate-binding domain-containing protein [Cytobacillus oceanisediminis]UOE53883.1 substrate-binding domain-containing protein [Cytobacillus oceanisediminis]
MVIFYPLGVLNESKNREAAQLFYGFMQSEQGMSKMEQYGFSYLLK